MLNVHDLCSDDEDYLINRGIHMCTERHDLSCNNTSDYKTSIIGVDSDGKHANKENSL